jgi:hypothetical protein
MDLDLIGNGMQAGGATPKYKVGDFVRYVPNEDGFREGIVFTISEVHANYGAAGYHRYYGADTQGRDYGAYEDELAASATAESERPPPRKERPYWHALLEE